MRSLDVVIIPFAIWCGLLKDYSSCLVLTKCERWELTLAHVSITAQPIYNTNLILEVRECTNTLLISDWGVEECTDTLLVFNWGVGDKVNPEAMHVWLLLYHMSLWGMMSSKVVKDIRSHTAPHRIVRWSCQMVLDLIILLGFNITFLVCFHIGHPK